MHSIPSSSLRWVLGACRVFGLDTHALLGGAGISQDDVEDPTAPIPLDRAAKFRQAVEEASGDPAFALHTGQRLPVGAMGVVDYVTLSSDTLRAALANLCRYLKLVAASYMVVELVDNRGARYGSPANRTGGARLEARFQGLEHPEAAWLERQSIEYTFSVTIQRIRLTEPTAVPTGVMFRHAPRVTYLDEYTRVFGVAPQFNTLTNAMVLSEEILALKPVQADDDLNRAMIEHARNAVARLDQRRGYTAKVVHALTSELAKGRANQDEVAQHLGITPRTLHRRLREEGATFSDLRDALRRELAEQYLKAPSAGVAEVGYLLGFSEPSAFHRAFRRWFDCSPQEFRRGLAR